jgi:transposase-like protein
MINVSCSLSERQLVAELRKIFFKKGRMCCTYCRHHQVYKLKNDGRYYCPRCRKKFSMFSGTWLRHLRIPLTTFMILLWSWMKGYSVDQACDLTKLSVPSIRRYFRLFRIHVVKSIAFEPQEAVQVDEAYFGSFKKQSNVYHGFKTYDLKPKVCVAGISCPSLGQLALRVIDGVKTEPIKAFIREKVPTTVRVYSDGSPIYTELRTTHMHTSQTHDQGFHNAAYIEGCWSWTKRKLFTQYHHFSLKYAHEYVSELEWRFNTRKLPKEPLTTLRNSLSVFH